MRFIDLLHRWVGGLIGLFLATLGLSGAILVHKDAWVMLPNAGDAQIHDVETLAAAITRMTADPARRPESFIFADENFGLHRIRYTEAEGAYANQAGDIVTTWDSKWDRVELWLFDYHHYLFSGEAGSMTAGAFGLCGLAFVITGVILWWRTRKTFQFRLLPARMSRPAIVRHHRDYGVVVAPLITLSMLTGVMLTIRPVADYLLAPWSPPKTIAAALAPPKVKGGPPAAQQDWAAMLTEIRRRYPDAEFRTLGIPRRAGGLISIRTKQPEEWLPQGRTTFWFDPADGRLVEARDALTLPAAAQIFNKVYPVHAAKVGGLPYRLVMTLSGLSLVLLGSLSVWSFWFKRPKPL